MEDLRKEISANNASIEERITRNIKESFGPKIKNLEFNVKGDLRNIIRSEVKIALKDEKKENDCAKELWNLNFYEHTNSCKRV